MPFLLLLLFNFLIIKEETKRYWADTHLGSPLPTSSIHHQGEQEKEGQGPWESFLIIKEETIWKNSASGDNVCLLSVPMCLEIIHRALGTPV